MIGSDGGSRCFMRVARTKARAFEKDGTIHLVLSLQMEDPFKSLILKD